MICSATKTELCAVSLMLATAHLIGCATPQDKKALKCWTVAVIPPAHISEYASDFIARKWIEGQRKRPACHKIIAPKEARETWFTLGIDHSFPMEMHDFSSRQADLVYANLKATHVAELKYKQRNGEVVITAKMKPTLPWIVWEKRGYLRPVTYKLADNDPIQQAEANEFLNMSFQLLPNAFSLGFISRVVNNAHKYNEKVEEIEAREKSALPPLLSSIGLGVVEHPNRFGYFDFTARGFGALNFSVLDSAFKLRPIKEGEPEGTPEEALNYDLSLFLMAPTINGEITAHTPIGAIFLSAGIGPAFIYVKEPEDGGRAAYRTLLRWTGGYRAFVSDRVYLQLSFEILRPEPNIVENELFVFGDMSYSFLGIGYYWPESRYQVRKLLNDFRSD